MIHNLAAYDVNVDENIRAEKRLRAKKPNSVSFVEKLLKSKLSMLK